jgi:hypothetical protein
MGRKIKSRQPFDRNELISLAQDGHITREDAEAQAVKSWSTIV